MIFLFLLLVSTAAQQNECGENEAYESCGTACPETCAGVPEICTANCVVGCFCAEGFVRSAKGGVCVRRESCQCTDREEYTECGSACPDTCTEQGPRACTEQCVPGCFCKEGLVRDKLSGRCIPAFQCPQNGSSVDPCAGNPCPAGQQCKASPKQCLTTPCHQYECNQTMIFLFVLLASAATQQNANGCAGNEEYLTCGTACPETCLGVPEICTANCVAGCFCADGFIRIAKDGQCVEKTHCQCTEDEEYTNCGSACPDTCTEQGPRPCTRQCVQGCFCKKGLVRDKLSGRCIPAAQCPQDGAAELAHPEPHSSSSSIAATFVLTLLLAFGV